MSKQSFSESIVKAAHVKPSLREQLIEWLLSEPEKFARWLDGVMFDSSIGECQICGMFPCLDGSCSKCIFESLDKPIAQHNIDIVDG